MDKTLTLIFKGMSQDDVTQKFHAGHQAWDLIETTTFYKNPSLVYGLPLCAPENCLVLGINGDTFTPDSHENLTRGYGIRLRGLETGLEYLYWHCLPHFPVWGGDVVKRGQIVAFMGNAGYVTVSGGYVPLDERTKDPYRGTHLHLEVYKNGQRIDPAPLFNWNWQPQYSFLDMVGAVMVVLQKILKSIK